MNLLNTTTNGADYTLTITQEGIYEIAYNMIINITGGGDVTTSIQQNANGLAGTTQSITAPSGEDFTVSNSVITSLDANDNITLAIEGNNISGTVEEASFTVKKLN